MFRSIIILIGLLILVAGTALAQDAAEERTLFVGPSRVICIGLTPQYCLQVKENADDGYTLLYDSISGFEYEPGYAYELQVSVTEVEDPPADASNLNYTLIEVVSKIRALEHNLWLLDSYRNADGDLVAIVPDSEITLEFADLGVNGSAGCNGYFGSVTAEGSSITISEVFSNLLLCSQDDLMNQEAAYLHLLPTVAAYEIADDQLRMTNTEGDVVLTFSLSEPAPLVGTNWVLTSYLVGGDAVAVVLPDVEVTAVFDAVGGLSGSGGCNNYSASYTADDGIINIGPAASTRMACSPTDVMGQESAYFAAMENVVFYQIRASTLNMLDATGNVLLSYIASG